MDFLDDLERTYQSWSRHNFSAQAVKLNLFDYQELCEKACGQVKYHGQYGFTIEADDSVPAGCVAFQEEGTGRWEIVPLFSTEVLFMISKKQSQPEAQVHWSVIADETGEDVAKTVFGYLQTRGLITGSSLAALTYSGRELLKKLRINR